MTSARDALNQVVASKATFTVATLRNARNVRPFNGGLLQTRGVFAITTASLCYIGDSKSRTLQTRWSEILRGVGQKDVVAMTKDPTVLFHVLDAKGLEWPDIQADMTRYPQFDLYSIRQNVATPYQKRKAGIAGNLDSIVERLERMEAKLGEVLKRLDAGKDFEV